MSNTRHHYERKPSHSLSCHKGSQRLVNEKAVYELVNANIKTNVMSVNIMIVINAYFSSFLS